MIRLELNHSLMHYYTELDCIMLCGVRNRPALHDYPTLRAEVARLHTPAPPEGSKHEELVPAGNQDEEEALVKGMELLKVDRVCCCPSEDDLELFETLPVCRYFEWCWYVWFRFPPPSLFEWCWYIGF